MTIFLRDYYRTDTACHAERSEASRICDSSSLPHVPTASWPSKHRAFVEVGFIRPAGQEPLRVARPARQAGFIIDNLCAASPQEQNRHNFSGETYISTVYRRPNCGINCMLEHKHMIKGEGKKIKKQSSETSEPSEPSEPSVNVFCLRAALWAG